jgi:hypothetical protein
MAGELGHLFVQPMIAGHRECPAGRPWGVTRQTLLLDVKEALVDEFVDAEGA